MPNVLKCCNTSNLKVEIVVALTHAEGKAFQKGTILEENQNCQTLRREWLQVSLRAYVHGREYESQD